MIENKEKVKQGNQRKRQALQRGMRSGVSGIARAVGQPTRQDRDRDRTIT